jgi:hypothetical protein
MDLNVVKEVLNRDRDFMTRVYQDTHGLTWFVGYQEISEKYKDRTIEELFNLYNSIVPVDDDSELFKAIMCDYLDDVYEKIKEEIKMRKSCLDRLHTYSDVQEEIRDWTKELGNIIIDATFNTEKTKEEIEKECLDSTNKHSELFSINLEVGKGLEALPVTCEYMDKLTDYYNGIADTNYTEKAIIINRAMELLDIIGELVEEKELNAIKDGMKE